MTSEYSSGQKTLWVNQEVDYPVEDRQKIGRLLQQAADEVDMSDHTVEEVAEAVVLAIEENIRFKEAWRTLMAQASEEGGKKKTEITT